MDKPEQPQEEYSYATPPASNINLNINLTELPKCACGGSFVPFPYTTNPKSMVNSIMVIGWACLDCGKNITYNAGTFYKQEVMKEKDSPI